MKATFRILFVSLLAIFCLSMTSSAQRRGGNRDVAAPSSDSGPKDPLENLKFRNLGPDHFELLSDQIPNVLADLMRMTLDRKQLADLIEREPELLRRLDKFEIGNFPLLIKPIAALRPRGSRQQPGLLVKADGINTQSGFLRDLANLQRSTNHHFQDTVWS